MRTTHEWKRTWVRRPTGAVAVLAAVVLGALLTGVPTAAAAPVTGRVLAAPGKAVAGSYVVILKDAVTPKPATAATARALTRAYGGQVTAQWQTALHGFAARLSPAEAAQLAGDSRVEAVWQDAYAQLDGDVQAAPPSWGLDRVDQRDLPLDSRYGYLNGGAGVHAYVIDSGIRTTHATFGGRASWGADFVNGTQTDCLGHGTHVAGTLGGAEYGVAKSVSLVAVRVFGCAGTTPTSLIISGVDWVAQHAVLPAVANMSLGGGAYQPLDDAVRGLINGGITVAIASGNDGVDACGSSPARVAEAITVNASERTDRRAGFSNSGACTDIFAPGDGITSAWYTSDTATMVESGTSMATPHVAGAAAGWLAEHPRDTPAQVAAGLVAAATPGVITSPGAGSPNLLLNTGTSNRLGVLTAGHHFLVKEGGLSTPWVDEHDGVTAGFVTGTRVGVLTTDGQLLVKEGGLSGLWIQESTGVLAAALSGDRIGVLTSDHHFLVKEGGLSTPWVDEHDSVVAGYLTGYRVGVLRTDGQLLVKEGGLSTGWTTEYAGVKAGALSGDRIGVVTADAHFLVKQGNLDGIWIDESSGVLAGVLPS
jgi:subtilisin family serine protease